MSRDGDKVLAAATGMGASALWWFSENERDRNDKLRQLKFDNRDLNDRLNELMSSGDWYRLTTSAVRDVISGLSTSNAVRTAATPIPSTVNQTRPDLSVGANIPLLSWPPATAPYNGNGNPEAFGELAIAAQAFTFEEPRAWNQGLTLSRSPSTETKQQYFQSAQGLGQALNEVRLSTAQYKTVWTNLFNGNTGGGVSTSPHLNSLQPPGVGGLNAGVASVQPLTAPVVAGHPYQNPQTDAAQRWRVTTAAGGVAAGSVCFTVSFATEYKWIRPQDGAVLPYQPIVVVGGPVFYIEQVSSTGFQVKNASALSGNTVYDLFVSVTGGLSLASGG